MLKLWEIGEDVKRRRCAEAEVEPQHHCCLDMAFAIAMPIVTEHQGPSRKVDWSAAWNEYRVPVAHDGHTAAQLRYCPFCGASLGPSLADEWYQRLYALGYADPGEEKVPSEFQSDSWWRKQPPN